MHESLVTIATFFHQTEFLLARARLESANIECFAQDENMLRIAGWHSHILGGFTLQVRESDAPDAMTILRYTAPINLEPAEGQMLCRREDAELHSRRHHNFACAGCGGIVSGAARFCAHQCRCHSAKLGTTDRHEFSGCRHGAPCASGKQPSAPDRRQHYRRHEAVYDELRGVSRRARQQAEPAGPFPVSAPSATHPRAAG